jgi:hypothetical protein
LSEIKLKKKKKKKKEKKEEKKSKHFHHFRLDQRVGEFVDRGLLQEMQLAFEQVF